MDAETLSAPQKGAYLPYPTSTLSPRIVPNDLSNFKTRGVSKVERELEQRLTEMREKYISVIDNFNWNKLIYEAEIQFEPILGQVYHLYVIRKIYSLSMIPPSEWGHKHIGSFRLNADQQWEIIEVAPNLDRDSLFVNSIPNS